MAFGWFWAPGLCINNALGGPGRDPNRSRISNYPFELLCQHPGNAPAMMNNSSSSIGFDNYAADYDAALAKGSRPLGRIRNTLPEDALPGWRVVCGIGRATESRLWTSVAARVRGTLLSDLIGVESVLGLDTSRRSRMWRQNLWLGAHTIPASQSISTQRTDRFDLLQRRLPPHPPQRAGRRCQLRLSFIATPWTLRLGKTTLGTPAPAT